MDPRLVSEWAVRYPLLLAAEDNVRAGGFGAAVLETLAPHGLAGKVRLAGLGDRFLSHGKPAAILAEQGLDPDGLAASVREALDPVGARRGSPS
jgi:1-deoxy-D-xylulose-5-phosphate synthase